MECAPAKLKRFDMSIFTPHNGNIPMPAILLLRQVGPIIAQYFPDWEVPAAFPGQADYFYREVGWIARIWPLGVEIEFPLFERLPDSEEKTLGESGQRKLGIASCRVVAKCSSACAAVELSEIRVFDNQTDEEIWHWTNK